MKFIQCDIKRRAYAIPSRSKVTLSPIYRTAQARLPARYAAREWEKIRRHSYEWV